MQWRGACHGASECLDDANMHLYTSSTHYVSKSQVSSSFKFSLLNLFGKLFP